MGLIVMGAATFLDVAPIPVTAVVLSLLALVNTSFALMKFHEHIHRRFVVLIVCAQLPTLALGLWLLDYLSAESVNTLRAILGALILGAGLSLAQRPKAGSQLSKAPFALGAGALGGVFGGLFSTSGAPLAFFFYRQPLPIEVIRASLLAIFTVSATARTILVGVGGELTQSVWRLFAWGVPVVIFTTWVARRFPPNVSEKAMKRFAFLLLALIGLSLMAQALIRER